MPETLSTVRWVGGKEPSQKLTRFLLSHETGHFLLNERVKGDPLPSLSESAATGTVNSPERKTMHVRPAEVRIPRVKRESAPPKENFILLKKYDGFVSSRGKDTFIARLFENAGDYPVMEAEFDLEEVSEVDRNLVVEGAALVWTIGYHDDGSRKRESLIYIRRRPAWDNKEIDLEKQSAEELTRGIQWK